ncbi:MAG: septation protein IspZ [Rhizomicrobium sp.]
MKKNLRLIIDWAPMLLFFVAYKVSGIFAATATIMVAAALALVACYVLEKKIAPVPLFTAVVVGTLGGLTLYLKDDTFIKMKPTFVYSLLALVLIVSELVGRPLVKSILGGTVPLHDRAWRGLAFRFGGFFLVMALLNEVVWRNFTRDTWMNYHLFGAMALTFVFAISQAPYMMKNQIEDEKPQGS